MHDIHKEFARPPHPTGAHVRAFLLSSPPSLIEELICFCRRVTVDDCEPELVDVMVALARDAVAARWELDEQLDRMLDGG